MHLLDSVEWFIPTFVIILWCPLGRERCLINPCNSSTQQSSWHTANKLLLHRESSSHKMILKRINGEETLSSTPWGSDAPRCCRGHLTSLHLCPLPEKRPPALKVLSYFVFSCNTNFSCCNYSVDYRNLTTPLKHISVTTQWIIIFKSRIYYELSQPWRKCFLDKEDM